MSLSYPSSFVQTKFTSYRRSGCQCRARYIIKSENTQSRPEHCCCCCWLWNRREFMIQPSRPTYTGGRRGLNWGSEWTVGRVFVLKNPPGELSIFFCRVFAAAASLSLTHSLTHSLSTTTPTIVGMSTIRQPPLGFPPHHAAIMGQVLVGLQCSALSYSLGIDPVHQEEKWILFYSWWWRLRIFSASLVILSFLACSADPISLSFRFYSGTGISRATHLHMNMTRNGKQDSHKGQEWMMGRVTWH